MNYLELADAAIKVAAPLAPVLSPATAEKVALAHIAVWITQQDETINASSVLATAQQAIHYVQRYYGGGGAPGPWEVRVHPFGGGYCLSRVRADGRREALLGIDGSSMKSFLTRAEARDAIAKATTP